MLMPQAGSFLVASLAPMAQLVVVVVQQHHAMVGVERVCVSSREYVETVNAAHAPVRREHGSSRSELEGRKPPSSDPDLDLWCACLVRRTEAFCTVG